MIPAGEALYWIQAPPAGAAETRGAIKKRSAANGEKFISNSISLINSKIEFHQKKKQTLTTLFKTLLHELMTGQRRVHEMEFK